MDAPIARASEISIRSVTEHRFIHKLHKVGEYMSTKIKIKEPHIMEDLPEISFRDLDEDDDIPYLGHGVIRDCTIESDDLEKLEISQVVFKNVVFLNVSFTRMVLTDVIFENCDLSNADFMEANMQRVEFRESKMIGINLADSHFHHVLFDNCMLHLGAFGYSRFKQAKFSGCMMQQVDCYECTFAKVGFDTCDLDEANFHQTDLNGIDLSTSRFLRLTVSVDDLRGCTISAEQAIGFATMLGLIIKE